MNIRRNTLLILLTVTALTLTFAAVATDDVKEPAQPEAADELDLGAVMGPKVQLAGTCITCVGYFNTGQHWAMGADCAAAATATENAARAAANAHCRSIGTFPTAACNFTFTVDACYDKMGSKVVDGHATYGCLEGDYFCPWT